jgi:hypothetical protein
LPLVALVAAMKARIGPARPEHIAHPDEALRRSAAGSVLCWSGLVGEEPVCMFGVGAASVLGRVGVPWLLGTDRLAEIPRAFARLSLDGVGMMHAAFPTLANWSDARHTTAHGWLRWLGFRLGEARPMGALGLPFVPFVMGAEDV